MRKVQLWLRKSTAYIWLSTMADMVWILLFAKERVIVIGMANYQARGIRFSDEKKKT
jgi:hypothetical protein